MQIKTGVYPFCHNDLMVALYEIIFQSREILSELSFFQVLRKAPPKQEDNPDNFYNREIIKKWIDNADFYDVENMPYIQYFNSFADLEYLLEHSDLKHISEKMAKYNEIRKAKVFRKWEAILEKVSKNLT